MAAVRELIRARWAKYVILGLLCAAAGAALEGVIAHNAQPSFPPGTSEKPYTSPTAAPSSGTAAFVTDETAKGPPSAAKDPSIRGAVIEALAFVRAEGGGQGSADVNRFEQSMLAHFAPEVRSTYGQNWVNKVLQATAEGIRFMQSGGQIVVHSQPVTYKVLAASQHAATVSVWGIGLNGVSSSQPLLSLWAVDTFGLEYTAEGWRMTSVDVADGPEAVTRDGGKSAPTGIPDQMRWTPVESGLGTRDG